MKIALVGDVMLGRLVNKILKTEDPAYPFGNTLSILKNADLRICNLECVLSDIGNPWTSYPKMFHFRSDEKNVKSLLAAKIDIVSLANNHVLDFEYEALLQMIDILDSNNILHAGAGKNLIESRKPALCDIKGEKIGMLSITDNEPFWQAEENKAGIYYVPADVREKAAKDFINRVQDLRDDVDYLIVSAHWGSNWGYDVPKEHVLLAHALIDAGADLIFGHSGHVFRGIEVYHDRPIIYCAGDFIDDYAVDEIEKNDESFIFILEKDLRKRLKLYLYPTCIREFQANLASVERQKLILLKMQNLCKELGTKIDCFSNYGVLEI